MKPLLGARIKHGTIAYFVSDPSQALAAHRRSVDTVFYRGVDAVNGAGGEVVTACRTYQEVDPWIVLEDINPQESNLGIFYCKWTPESPVPLEHDHQGRKRYKILDFARDEAEAVAVVNQLKRERDAQ